MVKNPLVMLLLAIVLMAIPGCSNNAPPVSPGGTPNTWELAWHSNGYFFVAQFQTLLHTDNTAEGTLLWTMMTSPRAEDQKKVGLSGTEYVRGSFDPNLQAFDLKGYKLDDPNGIVGLDFYRLLVADNGDALVGITSQLDTWKGRLSARRVPSPASEMSAGTYDVYPLADPAGASTDKMTVAKTGDALQISGTNSDPQWGSWSGSGTLTGTKGSYDWKFDKGQTGTTTFTVNPDGSLRGHISGSGLDSWYLAIHSLKDAPK